jgi:NTP pyrophosphatase (non-canonical NTP hydrolase)
VSDGVTGSGDFSIGGKVWPGISKLVEEAGEVIQVCGKLIALRGGTAHWDGSDLAERLESELGDLIAAASFVMRHNGLDEERVIAQADRKIDLFETWHAEGGNPPGGETS